jgi:ribosomal protein S27AE
MDIRSVNAWRAGVAWCLRGAGVVCVGAGAYLVLKKLLFAVGTFQFLDALEIYEGIGEEHSFYRGAALVIVGAVLAGYSRRLARFVITLPETGCPRCGYAVGLAEGDRATRCPECGMPGVREKRPE